jgi:hypothetical protein
MATQVPIPFLTTIDAKQSFQVANVVSMFAKTGFATVSNNLSLCNNDINTHTSQGQSLVVGGGLR